ncbi:heme biosynthesis protein HemY [Vibrio parahaemolyticus]|uniref:heme biosynthesis protein HemY n=1 Tax=Vibrio parahaemolyticus TaxID=670 RepID=UPI0004D8681F|nr:heme biosynthesis HemY N-terminal domain-containing protein [Vibrio parahaemolyticus]EGQ7877226.1 heme biosynthesis protein HemY [Vibrio parahaemolyticus]EGR0228952.1 heme biosynthesis protein HemY [Vibrio parahaemolyticus]EGR1363974.1 heme biosynthesis protein HemY [Vibrio parahaemolyticus]EGR9060283.1 heme biosynthesis protein HemY [Vibrio parahaemolyticus]EGU1088078.1 heme biosynthesis protein HemY [Vibrio parahaemolyticus]
MIRLIFLFVVLGAGLFAGTQFSGQQGYVLISIANKTIEMSVTTLVIFVIAALAGLFLLEYLIKKLVYASSSTWNYFSVRKMRRSRRYTNEGIIKLLEGDWKGAEKKVTRWANHHDMPLLCYLVASEAAQGQGDKAKRDHYLALASQQENAHLAVELTRAKQFIRDNEFEAAFDTLQSLKGQYPNNSIVLNLLKTTYMQLKLWQPLIDLMPQLAKAKLVREEEQAELIQKAQCGLLHEVAQQQGSEGLISHWNSLARKVKQDTHLIACFARELIARKADTEAFTVLKEALKKQPEPELYRLLPDLNLPDIHPVVVFLEGVVKKEADNAAAHSALAHFYFRQEKWQQAQEHFEIALKLRSDVSDYAFLADTLEKQNLTKAAHEVSRKALMLVQHD